MVIHCMGCTVIVHKVSLSVSWTKSYMWNHFGKPFKYHSNIDCEMSLPIFVSNNLALISGHNFLIGDFLDKSRRYTQLLFVCVKLLFLILICFASTILLFVGTIM